MAQRMGSMQVGVHMGVGRVVRKGFLGDGEDKKGFGQDQGGRMHGGNLIGRV